jgi:predicted DsbA family dithiol-disulfide isomerase
LEVLLGIAETHGLDSEDVRQALAEGRYDTRIHHFYHLALAIGVSATPAALVCNELFIGSRPLAVLQQSLDRCLINAEKIESGVASVSDSLEDTGDSAVESDEGAPPTLDR